MAGPDVQAPAPTKHENATIPVTAGGHLRINLHAAEQAQQKIKTGREENRTVVTSPQVLTDLASVL